MFHVPLAVAHFIHVKDLIDGIPGPGVGFSVFGGDEINLVAAGFAGFEEIHAFELA